MATNSKVFVSPGVYTSEVDLSFVAQSVGVTTLGIVGETQKGPAFEPIFIRNFDEFSTFFGGTSPEKFINTQIPKYEASYIAKAYLQQSNQLFVTRILGLSGYDAGPSWSITTIANVDKSTVGFQCSGFTYDLALCANICTGYTITPFTFTFTGCNSGIETVQVFNVPTLISNKINDTYETFNGSTSRILDNIQSQLFDIITTPSHSATSINYYGTISGSDYNTLSTTYTDATNVYGIDSVSSTNADYTDANNDPWYYSLFDNTNGSYSGYSFYNVVSDLTATTSSSNCASFYSLSVSSATVSNTVGSINYSTNTIDVVLPFTTPTSGLTALTVTFSACTTGVTVSGVTQQSSGMTQNFSAGTKPYVLTSQDGSNIQTWTVNVTIDNPCNPATSGNTGSNNIGTITTCYSGTVSGKIYVYSGVSYTDFDDMVIATLRSRGIATYASTTDNGPAYEVTGLTDVSINCTASTYSNIAKNPFSTFGLNVTDYEGNTFFFETSFSESDSKYLPKVFGSSNFAKPRTTVPLFVEERFQTLLNYGYNKGYIRGLSCDLLALPRAAGGNSTSIAYYLEKYQTPVSPWVVSEVRGNKVFNLFRFATISDGNDANTEVKISIANMSFNNLTFDVLVRDFFDTDNNPTVIEKFTNCTMDPNSNSFVAQKIGTTDGEYALNSKYIMVEMNEDAPVDTLPCGFQGFKMRQYGSSKSPFPIYKTKYDYPGEVVFDPPFGLSSGSNDATLSPGDNVRRTYLGISTGNGAGYDVDFFQYKGKQRPLNLCIDSDAAEWLTLTKGYHMDKNASGITISKAYTTSGTSAYYVGDATFTSDPTSELSPYYRIYSRKFSLLVQGGFDGWDIYRERRTNGDLFKLGRRGYLNGACSNIQYPTASGWGAFKQITVGNNTVDWGNSDYYAYLLGQQTFSNPEAVNINLFVTPGIDYTNNSDLVESSIEMIEFNRADSLYICTTADSNLLLPTYDPTQLVYPQEAVNELENSGIDSNYTATYYPWVLTRDSVNNTQIYLPPTAEVVRNLALTDNIAFPWFAAAGYTRGIVNAVKARKKLTQEDRDTLYQGRINPIATFSDVGTVIWGNKTLQVAQSALDRINVRRLLLQARKLISAVSVRLLFEQNDQKVRQDFLDAVNPILDAIRRDRGLYDFRVTVSSDAADLDRNQMTGKIYIKPTKSLEFIDITFYITPTGASFENI
jgi:hypothetical protein